MNLSDAGKRGQDDGIRAGEAATRWTFLERNLEEAE
jgi:hypothetical protein